MLLIFSKIHNLFEIMYCSFSVSFRFQQKYDVKNKLVNLVYIYHYVLYFFIVSENELVFARFWFPNVSKNEKSIIFNNVF